jgi:hypothetical protein
MSRWCDSCTLGVMVGDGFVNVFSSWHVWHPAPLSHCRSRPIFGRSRFKSRSRDWGFCASSKYSDKFRDISFIHSSVALQPFVGPWPLLQFLNLFSQSVGLLGRGISPPQGRYRTTQTQNKRTYRHPCLELDSKPRTQLSSDRKQFVL